MFKRVWMPVTGQSLQVRAETGNKHDSYAVDTLHDNIFSLHVRDRGAEIAVHLETKTRELFELPCRN